jgi:hypothetical protein
LRKRAVSVGRIAVLMTIFFLAGPMPRLYAGQAQPPSTAEQDQTAKPPSPSDKKATPLAMPSDERLVMLITSTLIALNQANATGNYSVFREMAAPGFQVANSTGKLADTFAELRSRNFDLSPIVLLQPKLVRKPEIGAAGMLRVSGFFPTAPERLNFDLIYQPINGQWRLFGIAADTKPLSAATAESTQAPAQPSVR